MIYEQPILPFGVVTACHAADYWMVKACCASIRFYSGGVPICLVADGEFDTSEVERAYGVLVVRTGELPDERMRRVCQGTPRSKLAAHWFGPFERYLYIDCDAIFWGDAVKAIADWRGDFMAFVDPSLAPLEKAHVTHFYMNPDQLAKFDPEFDYRKHSFFCAGMYAARRRLISIDEWLVIESWRAKYPDLFSFTTDQGIMNYLMFSWAEKGRIQMDLRDLQYIPYERPRGEPEREYPCQLTAPPKSPTKVRMLHFCGQKPMLHIRNPIYRRPYTAFRLLHYATQSRLGPARYLSAWLSVAEEELAAIWRRGTGKIMRHVAALLTGRNPLQARRQVVVIQQ